MHLVFLLPLAHQNQTWICKWERKLRIISTKYIDPVIHVFLSWGLKEPALLRFLHSGRNINRSDEIMGVHCCINQDYWKKEKVSCLQQCIIRIYIPPCMSCGGGNQLQTSFRGRGSAALYEASSLMIVHNHNLWLDQLHMNMKRWSCTSSASWHWFMSHTFLWFIDCVSSWTTFEPHCRSNLTCKLDSGSLVSQGLSWRWQSSIEEAFLGSMNTS